MDELKYSEIVVYQELAKLGFVHMQVAKPGKISITLTAAGTPVVLTAPLQEASTSPHTATDRCLHLVAGNRLRLADLPTKPIDIARRMSLRGWVIYEKTITGSAGRASRLMAGRFLN